LALNAFTDGEKAQERHTTETNEAGQDGVMVPKRFSLEVVKDL
jgi:hypothetical protein